MTSEYVLSPSDETVGMRFGLCTSISGTSCIVGAPYAAEGGTNRGAAYLYQFDGLGSWIETKITPSDPADGKYFGYSVAMEGDIMLIGAPGTTVSGNFNVGAIYAYRQTAGVWSFFQKMENPLPQSGGNEPWWGEYLDIAGSYAVVSGSGSLTDNGEACVIQYTGSTWVPRGSQNGELFVGTNGGGYYFGQAVSISPDGSRVIVGAQKWFDVFLRTGGIAYIYSWTGSQYTAPSVTQKIENVGANQVSVSGTGANTLYAVNTRRYDYLYSSVTNNTNGLPNPYINGIEIDNGGTRLVGGQINFGCVIQEFSGGQWNSIARIFNTDGEAYAGACSIDSTRVIAGNANTNRAYIFDVC